MKRHAILAVAIVLLTIGSVWAADISGKWAGKIPGGPGEVQIQEGKIGGDDISFSVMRNIGGTDMKVLWKGTISGDEIKFTRTAAAGGAPTEITARRTK